MVLENVHSHVVRTIDNKFLCGKEKPTDIKPPLANISISSISTDSRQRMLELTQHAWSNVYLSEGFQQTLLNDHSFSRRDYLKRIRKYGTLLRAAHNMFANGLSQDHDEFVGRLGYLNDNINTSYATTLSREMHRRSQSLPQLPQAKMVSDAEFQKKIHKSIRLVRQGLQENVLPFEAYHDIRKLLRNLNNLVLLLNLTEGENPHLTRIYEYAAYYITRMGENLDKGLVTGQKPIEVDTSIRNAMLHFLDVFTE